MTFPEMSLTETVVFRAPYRQIESTSYDTVRHKFGIAWHRYVLLFCRPPLGLGVCAAIIIRHDSRQLRAACQPHYLVLCRIQLIGHICVLGSTQRTIC